MSKTTNHSDINNDADSSRSELSASGFLGASPSNTAPAKYQHHESDRSFRLLQRGVDSLYLSYPGRLASTWDHRLQGLKQAARSEEDNEVATAQVKIGNHLFEVKDRGHRKFQYVLIDNCYHISLSSSRSQALPLAYAQLSSEMLTAIGVIESEKTLRYIVNTLGHVKDKPNMSRVDLFVDFTTEEDLFTIPHYAWISRAQLIGQYSINRELSGWTIGQGGVLQARLYDKTLEIKKSKKEYLKEIWKAHGWNEQQKVWRLEFQFNRQVLKELNAVKLDDLYPNLAGLWLYATHRWLRLSLPNPADSNHARWETHPLWVNLAKTVWPSTSTSMLQRVRKERLPSDEALFVNGLGGITSFMAREGITDLGEGFGEFLAKANLFHDIKGRRAGKDFKKYIKEKVATKSRKYNTMSNIPKKSEAQKRTEKEAYQRGKDGE